MIKTRSKQRLNNEGKFFEAGCEVLGVQKRNFNLKIVMILKNQTLFLRFIQGYLGFHLQKIYIVFEQAMLLQKNTFMREDPLHVFLS